MVMQGGVKRVLLYGEPGVGKTHAALHYANPNPENAYRLVCTEDLTSAEITGTWMPNGTGTWDFLQGPGINAWLGVDGTGGRLVVDEVDRASGDVLSQLLAMTDSPESARWRHPGTNEIIRPGENFTVIMTSNVQDPRDIPEALIDRFPVRIKIDRPNPEAVERLSNDLRAGALYGIGETRLSMRALYAFDELRKSCGDEEAARLVFGPSGESIVDSLRVAHVGR
jgi:MoxR-like ATPase